MTPARSAQALQDSGHSGIYRESGIERIDKRIEVEGAGARRRHMRHVERNAQVA